MQISKNDWNDYIQKLSKINRTAADLMQAYIDKNGISDVNAIIEYAYALITKYGEGSAALACEMYDAIAALSNVIVEAAEAAETATLDEVAKAIWGSLNQSKDGAKLSQIVGRLVKQAGADTTLKNAKRDNAEWAWVTSGDTCVFCLVLGSRGWQQASKAVLKGNHADHIHANCDCAFAIRFDKDTKYDSYDPDALYDIYNSAEGRSSQDKINSLRRMQYAQNKDYINAQKRAAYEARNEN